MDTILHLQSWEGYLLPHRKLTISIMLAKTKVIFGTADVVCLKKQH